MLRRRALERPRPILKERLFGLTNGEGNHGEDMKEYYFYLDSTLTHSYMKYLYKYPQAPYPYADLVNTNRSRSRQELEYELFDTGVFADNRYFDVFVEYAKVSPEKSSSSSGSRTEAPTPPRYTCSRPCGSGTRGRGGRRGPAVDGDGAVPHGCHYYREKGWLR